MAIEPFPLHRCCFRPGAKSYRFVAIMAFVAVIRRTDSLQCKHAEMSETESQDTNQLG